MVRKVVPKLPLWFCLYLTGHGFVPHFLTQTSFYCCQQQSPNVAAEEKKLRYILPLESIINSYRRNVIPESSETGSDERGLGDCRKGFKDAPVPLAV